MTNIEVIQKIRAALPLIEGASALGDQTQGPDRHLKELRDFLSALPKEQMLTVITIMYFGRGDGDSFVQMYEHCEATFPDSGAMAWQMLNKQPALHRYFEQAMHRAHLDGIDLNHPPIPVARR